MLWRTSHGYLWRKDSLLWGMFCRTRHGYLQRKDPLSGACSELLKDQPWLPVEEGLPPLGHVLQDQTWLPAEEGPHIWGMFWTSEGPAMVTCRGRTPSSGACSGGPAPVRIRPLGICLDWLHSPRQSWKNTHALGRDKQVLVRTNHSGEVTLGGPALHLCRFFLLRCLYKFTYFEKLLINYPIFISQPHSLHLFFQSTISSNILHLQSNDVIHHPSYLTHSSNLTRPKAHLQ
jgi:hypothetical protein